MSQIAQSPLNKQMFTHISYGLLITDLASHKMELTEPLNEDLTKRLETCNRLFEDVRTPREGVLDAVALKTISSFARIQTVSIEKNASIKHAFKLIRKCAKIIKINQKESDDVFSDFYQDFCHCHQIAGTMSFMSGRLPTNWFEQKMLEKSFRTPRTRRIKEVFDLSQRTQIEEIKKLSSNGEQTSKEIVRINRCLEDAYEQNQCQPVGFFQFTIHPKRFSRSVENIFHVSFLIKEGKVELFLDEDQLPVLRPIINTNQSVSETKLSQMQSLTQLILSLDMEQWETLIEVFQIENPMINP